MIISGPELPLPLEGAKTVQTQNKDGVIVIAGYDNVSETVSTSLFKFSCSAADLSTCSWTLMKPKLKKTKHYFTAIPVTSWIAGC